ncbi:DUF6199 family natural product biosynthesis protein [Paenibacillus endoradicis]|uniref:DUF6199 family natural product biosynthesis protein n=1 Tax=Paenibacillus endoradicis TaxID=2972487 RepID=UPI002158EAAE|nr:DUF6199 family natural product biosynthesis protein [Paenibacillus endoradicis]MCR8659010.1 hypothetical protein [Paenibacillus endoradicis]
MNGLIGFLFLVGGLIGFFSPQTAWYLSIGWKLRDSEPSDAVLAWNRISGVILVLIGFIMIASSCANLFTGGSQGRWAEQFQQRVEAGEISSISIIISPAKKLTDDELSEVSPFIREATLIPFDIPNSYSSSGHGTLKFNDGFEVDLEFFGSSGGIELHPNDIDKGFKIESVQLERWFRAYLNEMYETVD